jgi:hypothetical protein
MTTTATKKKTQTKQTAIPDLPTNPFTFEVLQVVSKQRSNAKKVEGSPVKT